MNFVNNYTKSININALSIFWAVFVAFLATSCGPSAPNLSILPAGQSSYQGSLANNKVDVLWVIDNSGSMLTKQQNLATSFDSFTTIFLNKGFDFNMAIATTDTRASPTGQAGLFQGAPTVINTSTPNFSNTFKANVVVGSFGDPNAKALDAIQLSLSGALLSGSNTGFLRNEAHLAVVILSDADDNDSAASVNSTDAFLNSLKPDKYDVIARTYKKNYTVSSVIVDTSNASNSACPMPFEDGVKFKQISTLTGGGIASICEANFSQGLTNISKRIAEAITEIPLARIPQTNTLSVKFNGTAVPNDGTNGWTYQSSGNKIVFHGNYIPMDQTSIDINYIPNDIIR